MSEVHRIADIRWHGGICEIGAARVLGIDAMGLTR